MITHTDRVRRQVLQLLLERGNHGATDCELYELLGKNRDTVRPRRCEYRDRGLTISTSIDRCRCGSTEFVDVILEHSPHNGKSIRRDCRRCGHLHSFPVWYGKRMAT